MINVRIIKQKLLMMTIYYWMKMKSGWPFISEPRILGPKRFSKLGPSQSHKPETFLKTYYSDLI